MKNFFKKYKWVLACLLAIILGVGVYLTISYFKNKNDAMFYEVRCLFTHEDANYSLIVDDKKAARAFKYEMENAKNVNDRADSCKLIKYSHATDQTLFVYATMTVLKDVTFAFKDEIISQNFYQVQYFTSQDKVASLSCNYAGSRFDCYDKLPENEICPDTLEDAVKQLTNICNFNEMKK